MFLLQVCVNRVYNTVMHTMTCKQFSTMKSRTVAVTSSDEGVVFTKNYLSHIESRISQWQIMVESQDKCILFSVKNDSRAIILKKKYTPKKNSLKSKLNQNPKGV